jgi:hypothetical protein
MGVRVAVMGAGGKMGQRITRNLLRANVPSDCVEISQTGIEALKALGVDVVSEDRALARADVVVLAVPDTILGRISSSVVPQMKAGAMLMLLDPAAAYVDEVTVRNDVSLFITHPCHPSVFSYDASPEQRRDFFGGVLAPQAIVCALARGNDDEYARGEQIARTIFAPVVRAHRVTLDQMVLLEPVMAETIAASLVATIHRAMETAVSHGVPRAAALDFIAGHVNIELGIVFGEAGNPFSDAAMVAIDYGREHLLRNNMEDLFAPEKVRDQISRMLHPQPTP